MSHTALEITLSSFNVLTMGYSNLKKYFMQYENVKGIYIFDFSDEEASIIKNVKTFTDLGAIVRTARFMDKKHKEEGFKIIYNDFVQLYEPFIIERYLDTKLVSSEYRLGDRSMCLEEFEQIKESFEIL